jgi:hypothetical protein
MTGVFLTLLPQVGNSVAQIVDDKFCADDG